MFRCDNCGSGYSIVVAASGHSCPRCLARDNVRVPLTFELGWRDRRERGDDSAQAEEPPATGADGSARAAALS